MANVKSKTTKAKVSKAPSSKPDLAQLTDFDKPADVTEDGQPEARSLLRRWFRT